MAIESELDWWQGHRAEGGAETGPYSYSYSYSMRRVSSRVGFVVVGGGEEYEYRFAEYEYEGERTQMLRVGMLRQPFNS